MREKKKGNVKRAPRIRDLERILVDLACPEDMGFSGLKTC